MEVQVIKIDQVVIYAFGQADVLAHIELSCIGFPSEFVGIIDLFKDLLAKTIEYEYLVIAGFLQMVDDQKVVYPIPIRAQEIISQAWVVHGKGVRGQGNGSKGNCGIFTGDKFL